MPSTRATSKHYAYTLHHVDRSGPAGAGVLSEHHLNEPSCFVPVFAPVHAQKNLPWFVPSLRTVRRRMFLPQHTESRATQKTNLI